MSAVYLAIFLTSLHLPYVRDNERNSALSYVSPYTCKTHRGQEEDDTVSTNLRLVNLREQPSWTSRNINSTCPTVKISFLFADLSDRVANSFDIPSLSLKSENRSFLIPRVYLFRFDRLERFDLG